MHSVMPKLMEAHLGSGRPQSQHFSLPGIAMSVDRAVVATSDSPPFSPSVASETPTMCFFANDGEFLAEDRPLAGRTLREAPPYIEVDMELERLLEEWEVSAAHR